MAESTPLGKFFITTRVFDNVYLSSFFNNLYFSSNACLLNLTSLSENLVKSIFGPSVSPSLTNSLSKFF